MQPTPERRSDVMTQHFQARYPSVPNRQTTTTFSSCRAGPNIYRGEDT
jgi:hypothetical protein